MSIRRVRPWVEELNARYTPAVVAGAMLLPTAEAPAIVDEQPVVEENPQINVTIVDISAESSMIEAFSVDQEKLLALPEGEEQKSEIPSDSSNLSEIYYTMGVFNDDASQELRVEKDAGEFAPIYYSMRGDEAEQSPIADEFSHESDIYTMAAAGVPVNHTQHIENTSVILANALVSSTTPPLAIAPDQTTLLAPELAVPVSVPAKADISTATAAVDAPLQSNTSSEVVPVINTLQDLRLHTVL